MATAPSASYRVTLRLRLPSAPGTLARVTCAIGEVGGDIGAIVLRKEQRDYTERSISVDTTSLAQEREVVAAVRALADIEVLDITDETFAMHSGGKIHVTSKAPLLSSADLSMAYTPGVARVCMAIHCLLYTSPSPRDRTRSRMPSSA